MLLNFNVNLTMFKRQVTLLAWGVFWEIKVGSE